MSIQKWQVPLLVILYTVCSSIKGIWFFFINDLYFFYIYILNNYLEKKEK